VVRPKRQKRNQDPKQLKLFKIPLVVNRFVMPLEMFADATKEEGKSTTKACGAVKEKPRKQSFVT
jgi:hypothetical protein